MARSGDSCTVTLGEKDSGKSNASVILVGREVAILSENKGRWRQTVVMRFVHGINI